ncbi:hypothetical protein PANDA_018677 [Ailuropoda melanoleuca]|uniref:5'-nucleotidase domain containing 1 n=1 Tax=Ailuropoda melanoleuca TaxID=9646 RepID=D2I0I8_AILME|nr:hypothetical protein PANDA_018677 [Ailuropoda melanoleuca]
MAQHFSLAACDVVGFDMDHTLCRYNLPESALNFGKKGEWSMSDSTPSGVSLVILKVEKAFLLDPLAATFSRSLIHIFLPHGPFKFPPENLIYNSFAQFLVKEKGYDKELLTVTPEDWDFCCKGLALDLEDGNFIKLADNGTVLRASHGTKMMPPEALAEAYGQKEWKHFMSDTGMACRSGCCTGRSMVSLPASFQRASPFDLFSLKLIDYAGTAWCLLPHTDKAILTFLRSEK